VRQYRLLQMETEQNKLEQLHAKVHALDQMEAELDRQRREAEDDVRRRTAAGSPVDPNDVSSMTGFRDYIRKMAEMLATRRVELNRQIAAQRQELLEARRRYEVLSRFRDKSKAQWTADFNKEQEELAGENYLARFTTELAHR
jgi:multidrug resistance efflux pump